MIYTVYGLASCDSTKAAIKYYKQNGMPYQLHDVRVDGITASKLKEWIREVGVEKLLNKKSTTWRTLDANDQQKATSLETAVELMITHTNLIKRPVIEMNHQLESVGIIPGGAKK